MSDRIPPRRRRRVWTSAVAVLAVLAIVVGINVLADTRLANARVDLTEQKLYTLSPGTRSIIAGLKDPITLRLYYSPELGARIPAYGAYVDRVREIIRQYADLSAGKIRLEFLNPEPFSETEDRAVGYGLQGVPLDQGGEQIYFGLVGTNLLDDERTIPFFQPERERFLEYDLSRLIYELSNPKRAVLGVMSSLPLDGDPRAMMMRGQGAGGPWQSMLVLRQAFTVKTVPTDAIAIDPDVQVLMVVQPQNLSDATLYAIDQFVMRGGKLMALVDPASETQAATPNPLTGGPNTATSSDLAKLFDAWGITFDPNEVVGDLDGAWRVRASESDRVQAVDYVAWFNIRDGISHDDPATADLQQVTVASPGALGKKEGAAIDLVPLLRSSDRSGLIPAADVRESPDPARILATFKPQGGPRTIAARVIGPLKSAFTTPPELPAKDGKPQERPAGSPAYLAKTDAANMVVIADTDILADRYWVRVSDFFGQQDATPFSDNGAFVANLVGTLAGGDALIGLRGRGSSLRPFTRIDTMQRVAEQNFRATEKTLQDHLEQTQKKLAQMRSGHEDGSAAPSSVITPEQRAAIDDLRHDVIDTRTKLRAVQLDLRRDIGALETRLRLFDIALVPAVLTIVAVVIGLARRQARSRARA